MIPAPRQKPTDRFAERFHRNIYRTLFPQEPAEIPLRPYDRACAMRTYFFPYTPPESQKNRGEQNEYIPPSAGQCAAPLPPDDLKYCRFRSHRQISIQRQSTIRSEFFHFDATLSLQIFPFPFQNDIIPAASSIPSRSRVHSKNRRRKRSHTPDRICSEKSSTPLQRNPLLKICSQIPTEGAESHCSDNCFFPSLRPSDMTESEQASCGSIT